MNGPTCATAPALSTISLHQGACVQLESDEQELKIVCLATNNGPGVDLDKACLRGWSRQIETPLGP